jgi:hypothetical protein
MNLSRIISYTTVIIYTHQLDDFDFMVEQKIEKGWQPFGPPVTLNHPGGAAKIIQAMVKYES